MQQVTQWYMTHINKLLVLSSILLTVSHTLFLFVQHRVTAKFVVNCILITQRSLVSKTACSFEKFVKRIEKKHQSTKYSDHCNILHVHL